MKDCLKKRGLDVRQARIMMQDRSVWSVWGFMGRCPGDEPLILTSYHNFDLQQLYEALKGGSPSVAKPTT